MNCQLQACCTCRGHHGLSAGAIAGIVIGAVAGVALLAGIVALIVYRRRAGSGGGMGMGELGRYDCCLWCQFCNLFATLCFLQHSLHVNLLASLNALFLSTCHALIKDRNMFSLLMRYLQNGAMNLQSTDSHLLKYVGECSIRTLQTHECSHWIFEWYSWRHDLAAHIPENDLKCPDEVILCRSISLNRGLTSKASAASNDGNAGIGKFQHFIDEEGQKNIELSPNGAPRS